MIVEICVGSLDDALLAADLGADRLEFCSALDVGGLTPRISDLERLRRSVAVPIAAMVRPRGGDFCYSDAEWRSMLRDARTVMDAGADAVVFGSLTADRRVDVARVREMVAALRQNRRREVVFHKAFDDILDLRGAFVELGGAGVDRVLTSGGAATAGEGAEVLSALVGDAAANAGRPTVLIGGGVRANNVVDLLRRTHGGQVHSACTSPAAPHRLDAEQLQSLIEAVRERERTNRQNAGLNKPEK